MLIFMHCSLCLLRISLLDNVFSGCFRQAFFIWETKKWSLVALDRWSSYTVRLCLAGLSIGCLRRVVV